MATYYKKNIKRELNAFFAYHGTPVAQYFPILERVTFDPTYSAVSSYESSTKGLLFDDLTPCTRAEFEEAKASALAVINARMDVDTVEIGHNQELQAA